jgi:DNA polymerase-3 subunit alpha (Gram-positive type)
MLEGNKHNQKICYGLECNVINKNIEIVKNPKNQEFNSGEYVVFDIETTGLHNEYDEITEFGAIKIRDNMIVEKVD